MDVTQEKIDDLTEELKVRIEPEDYQEDLKKTLKDYQQKANMPGFRKGKVPQGLIKKKYGQAILAEEINKRLQEAVQKHLQGQERQPLGNPIPKEDSGQDFDPDNPKPFEFSYEIGYAPDFEIEYPEKDKLIYYKVKVDKKMVDQQVEDLAKRYGSLVSVDEAGDEDMLTGDFKELDEDGNEKEEGIQHTSSIVISAVDDEESKKKLVGAKKGDEIIVDPWKISKGETDLASMLNIQKEDAKELDSNFKFIVQDIKRMQPAEVDQDLFDKVYGEGEVTSEEDFRESLQKDLEEKFTPESDKLFQREVVEYLIDNTDIPLPKEFIKKLIKQNSEEELNEEKLEEEYEKQVRGLKWQLIESKIMKDNDIKVEDQDAVNYTKSLLQSQYGQFGMPTPGDEELEQSARSILGNKDEGQRIYESLYGYKLMEHFKEVVPKEEKEVSYDEFLNLASEEQEGTQGKGEEKKEKETTT